MIAAPPGECMTARGFPIVLGTLILSGATAAAQPSFDCAKASTKAEKTICANPQLAAADAAMTGAYAALSKALPPAQQTGLRADQRQWVTERDGGCAEQKDDALVECLLAATDRRQRFLSGEGDNGPAGAPPLLPVFFVERKPKLYEISVAYPQFASPTGAKFNAAAKDAAIDPKAIDNYRQDKPNEFNGSSNFYDVSYETTYLDPKLVSVTLQFATYEGGAHPNSNRIGVLWNLAADKPVALGDFLADPDKAVAAISARCKTIAEKEDWGLFDNADFGAVVKDPKPWAVDKDGATIMFDPYAVSAYAFGPHDCRLTWAELKDWLKPGGALPPQ
jgi:uncharacterized protein YecT (DUF1311 family)